MSFQLEPRKIDALRRRGASAFFVALALGAAFASILQFASQKLFRTNLHDLIQASTRGVNWSTENDRRLEDLRRMLDGHTRVGYINETRHHPGELETAHYYYQTQYALAPISVQGLLSNAPSPLDDVIGDFRGPVDMAKICASMGLTVVRDYGNGLVLFRRAGAPR